MCKSKTERGKNMACDSSKDKLIAKTVAFEDGANEIEVSLRQYNGEEPKVQILRRTVLKDGSKQFAKLGRMSLAEWQAVSTAVNDMLIKNL